MKKVIYSILIFFSVYLVYYFIIKYYTNGKLERNNTAIIQESNITKDNLIKSFYENYNSLVTKDENIKINDISVSDTAYVYKKISSHVGRKPVLVIRYSGLDCFDCVRTIVGLADKNYRDNLNNIILLTDHSIEKDFKLKYDRLKTSIKILSNREEDILGTSLDNQGFPYMFIMDSNLNIHNIYIPIKEFPNHINSYLKIVMGKILTKY